MKESQTPALTRNAGASTQVTNLPIVQEDVATGAVAKSYSDYRERFGRQDVPGILECFATHPPLLEQMIALASSLLFAEGHLPRRVKEMIATYVSALNDCPYCLDSHASFLRTQGGSDELLSHLSSGDLKSPSISTKERQLLSFTRKVTNESYKVTGDDIRQLSDLGWSQLQIAEATHITALFAFFNRVANTFGLPSQHRLDLDLAQTNSKENQ
ncbi:MAG TPA: peroxidase-related enzyme [Edaphobacter sp.]